MTVWRVHLLAGSLFLSTPLFACHQFSSSLEALKHFHHVKTKRCLETGKSRWGKTLDHLACLRCQIHQFLRELKEKYALWGSFLNINNGKGLQCKGSDARPVWDRIHWRNQRGSRLGNGGENYHLCQHRTGSDCWKSVDNHHYSTISKNAQCDKLLHFEFSNIRFIGWSFCHLDSSCGWPNAGMGSWKFPLQVQPFYAK